MAEEMSRYLEIDQYFSGIFGGLPDANNKTKVLTRALEFSGAAKAQAAIIGDTHFDMTGGKNCSIACLGVLWGYGTAQELSQAGADQLFEGPQDLLNYLTL